MEEMLHMTLACNVLNAVGGHPKIDHPQFIPQYPIKLDFDGRDFDIGLIKFSKPSIKTFLKIEKPSDIRLNLKGESLHGVIHDISLKEKTIVEFYNYIQALLVNMATEFGECNLFSGDRSLQILSDEYYGGGGQLFEVHNLKTALLAIEAIKDQGEGLSSSIYGGDALFFDEDEELAHFFRFKEIYLERRYKAGDSRLEAPSGERIVIDWDDVIDMIDNPKAEYFPERSPARIKADEFNILYSSFLHLLHKTFNGEKSLMQHSVAMMYKLKYKAQELLNCPAGDDGKRADPAFQYMPPEKRD